MQIVPYSPAIAARIAGLFSANRPVPTRLWANLDGTIRGRILVDEPRNPTCALIQDLAEGPTYLGGSLTPDILREAFAVLRAHQEVVVCLWAGDPRRDALPEGHYYEGVAIDFSDRSPVVDLDRLAALPPGYSMRRIDRELARAIEGFDYYVTMFGTLERAVRDMIAYCVMQGETVVCEAVAAPLTRGVAEMGIETAAACRQRGLATAASAYVIRECEALGYRTFWNSAQQNVASVALARRLGFRIEEPSTVLAWAAVA